MSAVPTRKSITMMSNTGREHNLVGPTIRADSYFGRTDGIHTVQIVYTNFTGQFGLQGTLEVSPKEEDWFFINLNSFATIHSPYIRFPENPANIQGGMNLTGDTGTRAFTFQGNFVYLRAILDRSYIPEPDPRNETLDLGHIDRVLLCL